MKIEITSDLIYKSMMSVYMKNLERELDVYHFDNRLRQYKVIDINLGRQVGHTYTASRIFKEYPNSLIVQCGVGGMVRHFQRTNNIDYNDNRVIPVHEFLNRNRWDGIKNDYQFVIFDTYMCVKLRERILVDDMIDNYFLDNSKVIVKLG